MSPSLPVPHSRLSQSCVCRLAEPQPRLTCAVSVSHTDGCGVVYYGAKGFHARTRARDLRALTGRLTPARPTPDPAEQAPLVARSVTPPSPSGRGGTTLLLQRAPRSRTVFVMTPPNEHTSEGGRDDRGVPYHAESTLSGAQVLKVCESQASAQRHRRYFLLNNNKVCELAGRRVRRLGASLSLRLRA